MKRQTIAIILIGMMLPITASLILSTCGGGGGGGGFFLPSGPSGGGTPGAVYPRFAYVANSNDGSISMYTVNPDTGQLRHNGYVLAGTNPHSVAAHPTGKFVYVTNYGSDNVSAYKIETSGRVTPIAGSPFTAGPNPRGLAVHPNGQFLYVVNSGNVGALSNSISVYSIDPATGALGFVVAQATGTAPFSVTVHPAGKIIYIANFSDSTVSAFRIEANGLLTTIDIDAATGGTQFSITAGVQPHSVTLDPTGKFAYVANWLSSDVSAFQVSTEGALTRILCGGGAGCSSIIPDNFLTGSNPRMVTVHPNGKFAYVANHLGNTVSAFSINGTTGALTRIDADGDNTNGVQDFASGVKPGGVTIDPSGRFLQAANLADNTVSTFRIETNGGLTALPLIAGRAGNVEMAMTGGTAPVKYMPKFAYVVNSSSANVSAYSIETSTGSLTHILCGSATGCSGNNNFATGAQPRSIAVDPTGKFAYVANYVSGNVSQYTIGPGGALTPMATATVAAGANPRSITVDPSGKYAYVANVGSNDVSAYTIDALGGLTPLTDVDAGTAGDQATIAAGSQPHSATVDPTGRFVYVANYVDGSVSAYLIGPTGALTNVGTVLAGKTPYFITIHPSGNIAYVADFNDGLSSSGGTTGGILAYSINGVTGALTAIVGSPFQPGSSTAAIAVNPAGEFAYSVTGFSGSIKGYSISASGQLTGKFTFASGSNSYSVAVDPSGKFAYMAGYGTGEVSAYSIGAGGVFTSISTAPAETNPISLATVGTIE